MGYFFIQSGASSNLSWFQTSHLLIRRKSAWTQHFSSLYQASGGLLLVTMITRDVNSTKAPLTGTLCGYRSVTRSSSQKGSQP
ncbi:c4 [Columbid circovirus]|uniref:C4 n=1 Tax=Pigeon circovirus TaxID=126070 RepID=Q3YLC7_PICV|nr:c4 [Columbid circovirus]